MKANLLRLEKLEKKARWKAQAEADTRPWQEVLEDPIDLLKFFDDALAVNTAEMERKYGKS